MIASQLITYEIPPLKLSDKGSRALDWMEEFKVTDLPVVNNGEYLGMIEETQLLDRSNIDDLISSYNLNFKKPFVHENQHVFEIISLIVQNEVDLLPVLGSNDKFLGIITINSILKFFSETVSIANQGSIITIQLNINDYSLAEIAKIVESDNAKILASFITSHPDSTKLEVTLKINKNEITRILATFERFNYTITASYNETDYQKDLQNRYDEFMRFLNP
ncbi:MAG: CBS domain-containing protein [Vicingaceae bacterium]|jgi:acetoin utilization protein AcuB|nr:CBS domain-containing protein [Flavobacteriales bacterium]MBL1232897.1 CBS domain-containing protein [Flavobacteriales bacterium]MBQ20464.1 CBS domain-containing protein [Flavobacteriales bacterium]MDF1675152.1 CBS domain-containing protein [Vicingaceae bacterium]|tara:strand:- start:196130 stop:196792 length:663 start_codon:yes stop_codon:yes gene_type:complete